MRGKANYWKWKRQACRITPAYAGKRSIDPRKRNDTEDHPRLCGEKPVLRQEQKEAVGSPPPMRGKD